MKITMAATSAYDENEIHIHFTTQKGECISIGDMIDIPMIDHSYEKREIIAFVPKKKRGKVLEKIQNGESGEAIIYNIHSGWIKTESTPYIDDDLSEAITTTSLYIT